MRAPLRRWSEEPRGLRPRTGGAESSAGASRSQRAPARASASSGQREGDGEEDEEERGDDDARGVELEHGSLGKRRRVEARANGGIARRRPAGAGPERAVLAGARS